MIGLVALKLLMCTHGPAIIMSVLFLAGGIIASFTVFMVCYYPLVYFGLAATSWLYLPFITGFLIWAALMFHLYVQRKSSL